MIGSELSYWELALEGDGAALWIALALVGFTLAFVGWVLVAGPRSRRPFVLVGTASMLTLQSGLLVGALVWIFRAQDLAWATAGPRAASWDVVPILGQDRMVQVATVLLALAVPGTLLAWGRVVPRLRPIFAGAMAVSFGAALSTFWMSTARIDAALRSLHQGDPSAFHARVDTLDLAVWLPVVVAGLALVGLALWRRRSGPWTRSWVAPGVAALVCAAGVAAFVGTRGHAHDRHVYLPMWGPIAVPREAPLAPAGARCQPVEWAPMLRLVDDHATLEGRTVDREQLGQDLETMRRNWSVLHPREPFPGRLNVVTPTHTSWRSLEPWFVSAYDAGYRHVVFVTRGERTVHTEALGPLARPVPCGLHMGIAPIGPEEYEWDGGGVHVEPYAESQAGDLIDYPYEHPLLLLIRSR